ncbi:MAG: hypothetical protein GY827_11835 [Cytophagales bacterium]|nr:hypothetical protein [Cytophagales bacterium]
MKHIILSIVLLLLGQYAEASWFRRVPTNEYMVISFSSPASVFGNNNTYLLGAFVERGDSLYCVGGANIIENPTSTIGFRIYGKEDDVEGAIEGEKIILLGANISSELPTCEILLNPILNGEEQVITYKTNDLKEFDTWSEYRINLNYSKSIVCGMQEEVLSPKHQVPEYYISNYTLSSEGLLLDKFEGSLEINTNSYSGEYTIYSEVKTSLYTGEIGNRPVVKEYCIEDDSFIVLLVDTQAFSLDNYVKSIHSESCDELNQGSIELDLIDFPYQNSSFEIEHNFEVTTYDIASKLSFSHGSYLIKNLIDKYECAHPVDYTFNILIDGDCEEEYILIPNTYDTPTEINFDQEGEIKIVNKHGIIVKVLEAPVVWRGDGETGDLLEVGIYFIYNNDEFLKTLHVYR